MVAAALVALVCRPAAAEPTLTQTSVAQALFADGRAAIAAGRVDEACSKFAQSYQVDASAGTLLNLGICHERQGRLGSAYAELGESVSRAIRDRRPDREKLARAHLSLVAPRVSRVIVQVGPRADEEGLVVSLDGFALTRPVWGTAVPVDRGAHTVLATAPGKRSWRGEVSIVEDHETRTIEVAALEAEAVPVLVAPVVPVAPEPRPAPVASLVPPTRSAQRSLGWGTLGLGAAAVGTGSVFGLLSFARWNGARACPSGVCPSLADKASYDRAGTLADISTVWFAAGGAALAAGALLVLLAPKGDGGAHGFQVSPVVGGGALGIVIGASR